MHIPAFVAELNLLVINSFKILLQNQRLQIAKCDKFLHLHISSHSVMKYIYISFCHERVCNCAIIRRIIFVSLASIIGPFSQQQQKTKLVCKSVSVWKLWTQWDIWALHNLKVERAHQRSSQQDSVNAFCVWESA